MSNQPNEAAEKALCALNLTLAHSGIDPTLAERNPLHLCGIQARLILAAIRDGKVPGVYAESPGIDYLKIRHALSELSGKPAMAAVTMDHIGTIGEQISSLRSALANAEKQIEEHERWRTQHGAAYQQVADARDAALAKLAAAKKDAAEWKESSRAWQEQASVIHLERDRLECDALRSALAAAEKERDEFAEKVGELAFIRHNLTEERNSLAAQLAEARGLLQWIADRSRWRGRSASEILGEAMTLLDAFLAPPSDRGAEEIGHE